MTLEELRKQFLIDDDAVKARLEPLVAKALLHCKVDKSGQVLITNSKLSSRDQLVLILAARWIASELDPGILSEVTVAEVGKFSGLPANQIRARGTEAVKGKFAEALRPGTYRAVPHRIESFLNSINDRQGG
jgi:hypothetical protein